MAGLYGARGVRQLARELKTGSVRARAANSAGASVSGRAPGSMPAARSPPRRPGRGASCAASCGAAKRPPRRRGRRRSGRRARTAARTAVRVQRTSIARAAAAEGAGADVEQRPYAHMRRQHHRQPPVVPRPGPGRHARDDFLLQHEVHVGDRIELLDQPEQQRRRDVVRQVADKPQLGARAAQRPEIELERIGQVHPQLAPVRAAPGERRYHVGVDLDDVERACAIEQGRVIAPRPGPISTSRSPGCGSIARTIRSIVPGSCRKCCP